MMLTTRGRYAVTSLIDIATLGSIKPVNLTDISIRQNISIRYLEQIFLKLKNAGLVRAVKGPGGGYVLSRALEEISIKEIIDAAEEKMEMTRCGNSLEKACGKNNTRCATHHLWNGLGNHINAYLRNISIKDVIENRV